MHSNTISGPIWIIALIFGFLFIFCIYFLPSIVAISRKANTGTVIVLNLFLGWTLIGWVVSLALAFKQKTQPQIVVVHQPYPYQHQ